MQLAEQYSVEKHNNALTDLEKLEKEYAVQTKKMEDNAVEAYEAREDGKLLADTKPLTAGQKAAYTDASREAAGLSVRLNELRARVRHYSELKKILGIDDTGQAHKPLGGFSDVEMEAREFIKAKGDKVVRDKNPIHEQVQVEMGFPKVVPFLDGTMSNAPFALTLDPTLNKFAQSNALDLGNGTTTGGARLLNPVVGSGLIDDTEAFGGAEKLIDTEIVPTGNKHTYIVVSDNGMAEHVGNTDTLTGERTDPDQRHVAMGSVLAATKWIPIGLDLDQDTHTQIVKYMEATGMEAMARLFADSIIRGSGAADSKWGTAGRLPRGLTQIATPLVNAPSGTTIDFDHVRSVMQSVDESYINAGMKKPLPGTVPNKATSTAVLLSRDLKYRFRSLPFGASDADNRPLWRNGDMLRGLPDVIDEWDAVCDYSMDKGLAAGKIPLIGGNFSKFKFRIAKNTMLYTVFDSRTLEKYQFWLKVIARYDCEYIGPIYSATDSVSTRRSKSKMFTSITLT